jgi:hypothetical protein
MKVVERGPLRAAIEINITVNELTTVKQGNPT